MGKTASRSASVGYCSAASINRLLAALSVPSLTRNAASVDSRCLCKVNNWS
ncbi:hypothetical protein KFQ04_00010 [Pseudomonas synxantha]|nr:hypothetical protein KFQ04_00010 [Pseudomonas synxantha]